MYCIYPVRTHSYYTPHTPSKPSLGFIPDDFTVNTSLWNVSLGILAVRSSFCSEFLSEVYTLQVPALFKGRPVSLYQKYLVHSFLSISNTLLCRPFFLFFPLTLKCYCLEENKNLLLIHFSYKLYALFSSKGLKNIFPPVLW